MEDIELPLTAHLQELRTRLLRALIAVIAAFVVCYPLSNRVFVFLTAPLTTATNAAGTKVELIGTGVTEAFFTRLKVCAIAALFVALPVILHQVWMFIVPGLKDKEARYARSFVFAGTFFFLAGAAFCHQVVFPAGFPFFLQEYENIGVTPNIRIAEYLTFAANMMLAFGVTFELPVVTFFLARTGLITHLTLIQYGRYAIIVIFIVAAVLTPGPDVASQMLMAAPLLVLYALSIGIAYFARREPTVEAEVETREVVPVDPES
jgi:sec-independent protein translocase protein TatC